MTRRLDLEIVQLNRMTQHVVLFGERCSGTKYLQKIMETNFVCDFSNQPTHKHFFGHQDLRPYRNSLFVCVVRAPVPWLNSFYRNPWHLLLQNARPSPAFLRAPVRSYQQGRSSGGALQQTGNISAGEIMEDREIGTQRPYRSVLALRNRKLRYMLDDLPLQAPRVIVVRYEDLLHSFDNVLLVLRASGLNPRQAGSPLNITAKIGDGPRGKLFVSNVPANAKAVRTDDAITPAMVITHPDYDPDLEARLGYSVHTTAVGGLGIYIMNPVPSVATATYTA